MVTNTRGATRQQGEECGQTESQSRTEGASRSRVETESVTSDAEEATLSAAI
ncbi:hypothetical protein GJ744_006988 [Endocarpon pusillum]|uniref:Uncharacterized protein n=1 Tax=Endocarpon pusillum TaxID=364733 RepID=A0A8H7DXY7_9EURO|nr:hypothetical protein GJ744_006988 [Endocarpon pusillum]